MILISGAGLTGLIFAKLLLKENICKSNQIVIVEKASALGGLFRPFNSKNLGEIDKGMHIYYETLIDCIDKLVYESFLEPEKECQILEGNRKDIAGAYFNGRLQIETPYPDLRSFGKDKMEVYEQEIINNLSKIASNNSSRRIYKGLDLSKNLRDYWVERFGMKIFREVLSPIAEKLYGLKPEYLSSYAAYFVNLNRLAIFEKDIIFKLGGSNLIREIIAYPDQLNLPPYRSNNQKGLYPKKGMMKIIDSLSAYLIKSGVKIFRDTKINQIKNSNKFYDVYLTEKFKNNFNIKAHKIIWTGDQNSLYDITCNQKNDLKLYKDGESEFIYARIKPEDIYMPNIYYFYCYEKKMQSFRVTNMSSYSGKLDNEGRLLICIEKHLAKLNKGENLNKKRNSCERLFNELSDMGVLLNKPEKFKTDYFLRNKRVFPIPSLIEDLKISNLVKQFNFENIYYPGKNTLPSKKPFFLSDILKDLYFQLIQNRVI